MGAAPTLRVARPVGDLARSRRMYAEGLGLSVLGGFEDHAGFVEVPAFNPYWNQGGRSFADADGYRIVLHHGSWPPAA